MLAASGFWAATGPSACADGDVPPTDLNETSPTHRQAAPQAQASKPSRTGANPKAQRDTQVNIPRRETEERGNRLAGPYGSSSEMSRILCLGRSLRKSVDLHSVDCEPSDICRASLLFRDQERSERYLDKVWPRAGGQYRGVDA